MPSGTHKDLPSRTRKDLASRTHNDLEAPSLAMAPAGERPERTAQAEVRITAPSLFRARDYLTNLQAADAASELLVTRVLCAGADGTGAGLAGTSNGTGHTAPTGLSGTAAAEIRFTRVLLPPMMIYGTHSVGLLWQPEEAHGSGTPGSAWLQEPAVATLLAAIFDSIWVTAVPAATRARSSAADASPTAAEAALLRLLAADLTYPAIARRLGVSSRTVERRVALLTARLEARGRFQALHEAARRGWL
jgi:DNA-binding CsgD family transcriptional regulator